MKRASAAHNKLFTVYAPEKGVTCAHTQAALKMLDDHEFKAPEDIAVVYVSKNDLQQKTGQSTYPQVYMKNNHIGGEDKLVGYMKAYKTALEDVSESESGSGSE
jgi:glutaredoxin